MTAEKKVEPISADGGPQRERSTIEFSYFDLDSAIEIATGVKEVGGSSCEWDQLAAHLNFTATGGGYRQRLISAKQFDLVTYERGRVMLTPLGMRIADPKHERAAKVEAFLNLQLHKAVYEKYRGTTLPPVAALEREMIALGVAKKQADKARQAFQRSAKSAGFFEFGPDRLVMPANVTPAPAAPKPNDQTIRVGGTGGSGGGGGDDSLHPFIRGLLDKLPSPETDWPVEARAKWLTTASNIFDLLYSSEQSASISIRVTKDGGTT